MKTLFERCRTFSSLEVARHLGIAVTQRGSRARALCPFHSEKTPSLVFYPDGKWRCFGCNRHGDAVDFYSEMTQQSPHQAATALVDLFENSVGDVIQSADAPDFLAGKRLMQIVDKWFWDEWDKACESLHRANRLIRLEHRARNRLLAEGREYNPPDIFYTWVAQANAAQIRLEMLDFDDPYGMMMLMLEEQGGE